MMDSFDSCYRVNLGLEEDDSLQDLNSLPVLLYQRKFHVVENYEDGNQSEDGSQSEDGRQSDGNQSDGNQSEDGSQSEDGRQSDGNQSDGNQSEDRYYDVTMYFIQYMIFHVTCIFIKF